MKNVLVPIILFVFLQFDFSYAEENYWGRAVIVEKGGEQTVYYVCNEKNADRFFVSSSGAEVKLTLLGKNWKIYDGRPLCDYNEGKTLQDGLAFDLYERVIPEGVKAILFIEIAKKGCPEAVKTIANEFEGRVMVAFSDLLVTNIFNYSVYDLSGKKLDGGFSREGDLVSFKTSDQTLNGKLEELSSDFLIVYLKPE